MNECWSLAHEGRRGSSHGGADVNKPRIRRSRRTADTRPAHAPLRAYKRARSPPTLRHRPPGRELRFRRSRELLLGKIWELWRHGEEKLQIKEHFQTRPASRLNIPESKKHL
ncbi:hypothetical protein XENORESO_006756 [Xenotaenia resolanae]|uniref:Uncharacterized protein n=1 Tax=Xenotaenia resolanae TaxID=208358 RepID=A0ABV0VYI7_9TELE